MDYAFNEKIYQESQKKYRKVSIRIIIIYKLSLTNWFISYLNDHRPSYLYISSSSYNTASASVFADLIINSSLAEERILEYYINTLLFSEPNIEPFKPYLKLDYLKSAQSKILILKGESIESIEHYTNYTESLKSIELEPCPTNPTEFNHNELVKFA
jgi:hypothetical protein